MLNNVNYPFLVGILATVGHGQKFFHSTVGGVHSVRDSFSKSWSFSRDQNGHYQKTFQSTEIYNGHVEKEVENTYITRGAHSMERKDTKLFCHDGKCKELVEEFRTPARLPQKSMQFLAPVASQNLEANTLSSRVNAWMQHIMGRGAHNLPVAQPPMHAREHPEAILSVPAQQQKEPTSKTRADAAPIAIGIGIDKKPMMMRWSPWKVNVKQVTPRIPSPSATDAESHNAVKLGGIFCGTMVLLSLLTIAAKCRQSDISAREISIQGLAAPLAPGEENASALPVAKPTAKDDVAGVRAVVSKYLPHLYACAQARVGVSLYLSRVYARAAA
jgi:hypothetical protein